MNFLLPNSVTNRTVKYAEKRMFKDLIVVVVERVCLFCGSMKGEFFYAYLFSKQSVTRLLCYFVAVAIANKR